ncbi:MAG TPA: 3-hydroxybutyryl-CoA dehydrogenase [Gammaproteobacteria bacterium]|nr:3-hydroxybutyryl-CoA dehydrogenase [Gammaproteobacteria bacterium]HAF74780.1 3-hydroxybutyryl-CoA dehydrogenase [Gammaproteobacteria bacterium]|tara:strand:- start:169 stop:1029 length:861 start_codon:yes stop_codon:yes gene_type:complete
MIPSPNITVLGAGQMGQGIAHISALAGFNTRLYDKDKSTLEVAMAAVEQTLSKGVELGKITNADRARTLERLTPAMTVEHGVEDAGLVIEAIPEDINLKKDLFRQVADSVPEETVLASNTSSLSITEIASGIPSPDRVVGMHFFNPPHIIKLLEVIRGEKSASEIVDRVCEIGRQMDREVVLISDSPGFASSRLGVVLGLEAIRMLEQGVASAADIDAAMVHGYRHPIGPLRLTDLVGLDVRLAIAQYLHEKLGSSQFEPPKLLQEMVRDGLLGKKSGKGFYCWKE